MSKHDLTATIKRLSENVPNHLSAENVASLENLSIKELRQYVATSQPGVVNPMTERASIVSVIIWVLLMPPAGEEVEGQARR